MNYLLKFSNQYLKELPAYFRHADFLDGSADRVAKYLIRHLSERSKVIDKQSKATVGQLMWSVRLERLANENLCEPVLSTWLGFLCQPITHTLTDQSILDLLENIDGFNTKLDSFVSSLFWEYLGFGSCGVLVEAPVQVAATESEAIARGERSYSTLYDAFHIASVSRFTEQSAYRGQLKEVVLLENPIIKDDKAYMSIRRFWIDTPGALYKSQRFIADKDSDILDKTSGVSSVRSLLDKYGKGIDFIALEEEYTGSLDRIPFVYLSGGLSESIIKSAVQDNKEHLNKKSARDTINYYQCWQKIAFFGVNPDQLDSWSENIAAFFSEPTGSVSAIPPGDPAALTEDLDKIKRDSLLRSMLQLKLLHQLATRQVQSAESKKEDNQAFQRMLNYYADKVQDALRRILSFHCEFEGIAYDDLNVTLARDYDVEPTQTELSQESLAYSWASDFGASGRKLKAEMLINKLSEMHFAADDKTDSELKTQLIEAIRSEAEKEPQLTSNRFGLSFERKSVSDEMLNA